MNATKQLNELGQSIWLDNITRERLQTGMLNRYCVLAAKANQLKPAVAAPVRVS